MQNTDFHEFQHHQLDGNVLGDSGYPLRNLVHDTHLDGISEGQKVMLTTEHRGEQDPSLSRLMDNSRTNSVASLVMGHVYNRA